MSVAEPASGRFFFTGGTLPPEEPSYIERAADQELWESLQQGDLCYILTCRQIGKSSLVARAAKRLRQLGDRTAYVDLTSLGTEVGRTAANRWYYGLANAVHRALRLTQALPPWWAERERLPPVQRLVEFFTDLVLPSGSGKVVLFFDEIESTIRLPFAGDFFAALRACYNARATEPDFRRLVFVLIGVATPAQLISDPVRTPFNVGKSIELTDFSRQEAAVLARGFPVAGARADTLLDQILGWTRGQPYLTQVICKAVAQRERDGQALPDEAAEVARVVEDTLLAPAAIAGEVHLRRIAKRLIDGSKARPRLKLYRRILKGERVLDEEGLSPLKTEIKLSGIVRRGESGILEVRNRIYEQIFGPEWVAAAMPPAATLKTYAAAAALLLAVGLAISLPLRDAARQLDLAARDWPVARNAYETLHRVPFLGGYADEHLARFFDRRALRLAALEGKEDETLLFRLEALAQANSPERRRRVQEMVGSRYYQARLATLRVGPALAATCTRDGTLVAVTPQEILSRGPTGELRRRSLPVPIDSRPREDRARGDFKYTAAAFYGDHEDVLLGDSQGSVWRLKEGSERLVGVSQAHCSGEVQQFSVSRDGSTGLERCANGTDRMWNERVGRSFPLGKILSAVVSPDATQVAIVRGPKTISILSTTNGRSITTLTPPFNRTMSNYFFKANKRSDFFIFNDLETIERYDTRGRHQIKPTVTNTHALARSVNADGTALLAGTWSDTVDFWDDATARWTRSYLHADDGSIDVAFAPDGHRAVSSGRDGVKLWSLPLRITRDSQEGVNISISISQYVNIRNQSILSLNRDGEIRIWSTLSGRLLGPPTRVHLGADFGELYTSVASIGTQIFVAHPEPMLLRLGSRSGIAVAAGTQVSAAAFTPDGKTLITGDLDGMVQFWSTATGRPSGRPIQSGEPVEKLAVSPDGRTIVAVGAADPGQINLLQPGVAQPVARLKFFSNGGSTFFSSTEISFTHDSHSVLVRRGDRALLTTTTGTVVGRCQLPYQRYAPPDTIALDPATGNIVFALGQWIVVARLHDRELIPVEARWFEGDLEALRVTYEAGRSQLVTFERGAVEEELRIQRVDLNHPPAPDLQADPAALLATWKRRLDLDFNENMEPTPGVREHPAKR
ncbi:MAG: AAA-like domain-containing protein [Acidobacteriota bacterium]|nr:AAA-like domain-containing protein [Acidobacteriota bacterium]